MVFRTDGLEVILTPFRSPQANAHAERFVRTARTDCLDWMLILGPRHLDRVLRITSSITTPSARTDERSAAAHPSRPSGQRRRPRT